MRNTPEYEEVKQWHLIDQLEIHRWLSEILFEKHKKIKCVKQKIN